MIVEWTYESCAWTLTVVLLAIIFLWWSRSIIGRLGIIVGMAGLWLMLVEPQFAYVLDKKSREVSDIMEFLISEQAQATDTILLQGLHHPLDHLSLLDSFVIVESEENEILSGFSSINYRSRVTEGEEVVILGSIYNKDSIKANVALRTPDNKTLSATELQDGRFEFRTEAPPAGLFTYELMLANGINDTIRETVPIIVKPAEKLTMLVYASTPRFELNYLKNFWVDEGHGIIQKVKVSNEKFNTTMVNSDVKEFQSLTTRVLDELDILLLDIQMWNALSGGERTRVITKVKEQGKGLLFLPSLPGEAAKGLPFHRLTEVESAELNETNLREANYSTNAQWSTEEYGWKYTLGYGNIYLLKWDETYKLLLNNRKPMYRGLWTEIFSEVFRTYSRGFSVTAAHTALADERMKVRISGTGQSDTLTYKKEKLAVLHTPYLEAYGTATLAADVGWNEVVRLQDGESDWFYAHSSGAWRTMREMSLRAEIKRLTGRNSMAISSTYNKERSLPWWIPLLIFLLGMGATWLSEKLM